MGLILQAPGAAVIFRVWCGRVVPPPSARQCRRSGIESRGRLPGMIIRVAAAEDWPRIWPCFQQIVAAGETYAYPEDLTEETARPLWLEPPPGHAVVAVDDDGTVLGSAKTGPNRPGRGAHVSTASFMVDPAHGGKGV